MIALKNHNQSYIGILLVFALIPSPFQFPKGTLHQFKNDGITVVPQGGTAHEGSVVLGISFRFPVIIPLKLQIELRSASDTFTGVPTATSGIILLNKSAAITVSDLVPGNYHWQARLLDTFTGATSEWRGFGGEEKTDLAITAREPIVIVPGISGSILQNTADQTEVWPNIGEMLTSPSDDYLDALILDSGTAQPQSTIRAVGILKAINFTWGGVNIFKENFYGNLIAAFIQQGYEENKDLYTVPYDWRLDVGQSFSALAAIMARAVAASPTGKIVVIAHSMGGLLMKRYLAAVPDAAFLDKIIMVGVPQWGAPYALQILNDGDMGIPVANRDEIRKIAGTMPSIYELLPSSKYTAIAGAYAQDFRTASDTLVASSSALLETAHAFHALVDDISLTTQNVYSIIGCGKSTITGFQLYDGGQKNFEQGSGDGTVPVVSALHAPDPTHSYFVLSGKTGIDHTGLVSDPRPVSLIVNIVSGVAQSLPQGISSSASDCGSEGFTDETTVELSNQSSSSLWIL